MAKRKIKDLKQFVRDNTIDADISYRGGTLKVDVSKVFKKSPKGEKLILGAGQNYLGGGIAGRIFGASMFDPSYLAEKDQQLFENLKEASVEVFHEINNGGGDDYMQSLDRDLFDNQNLPVSAY